MRSYVALAALATMGFAPMLTGCSNKATEEQMKALGELDRQREGYRADLQRAQSSLSDVRGKLANADRDLKDCNDDTQAASAWLQKWPNVWADSTDWRLAPPPPPPAPEKSTKKSTKR